MPKCIYCLKAKPAEKFDNEHVLSRAFCGQGANWTLVDTVCRECNGKFSAFESHWTQSAIEGVMRNFSGPIGRSGKSNTGRTQPTEIDHLYVVQRGDLLAYEAGFAFPNEFYFRPQILHSDDGLVSIVANPQDGQTLTQAVRSLIGMQTLQLSQPRQVSGGRVFSIATICLDPANTTYIIQTQQDANKPSGYWVRDLPNPPTVKGFDGEERLLTPRLALDDRGRLYFRAANIGDSVTLLDNLIQGNAAPEKELPSFKPEDQTIRLGFRIKRPLVFRAVMKTGINLVANEVGAGLIENSSFDEVRRLLFDKEADDEVMGRCSFLSTSRFNNCGIFREAFPPVKNSTQHRLMLDIHKGKLWFRMRLYGHLGYQCELALATPEIRNAISTTRVVVDYETTGIRRVDRWP